MAIELQRILIDKGDFRALREGSFLYVDKTEHYARMLSSGVTYFFLSRPRRFGKSLTVSTLESLFKGERELFKGLYIENNWNFDDTYPVLHFDMSELNDDNISGNKDILLRRLSIYAQHYEIDASLIGRSANPGVVLSNLIESIHMKTGKKVVVLIDEYDYPLLEHVRERNFESYRKMMEQFYSPLKTRQTDIQFCFVTGITRFSQVSIFSKLNNLVNITESSDYAAICGYTDEEMDRYFTPYFEKHFEEQGIAREEDKAAFRSKVGEYYDGYRFTLKSPETLYNPVSVGKFVSAGCKYFENYWIETGGQSIVRELLGKYPLLFADKQEFYIAENSANSFEANSLFCENASEDAVYSYLMQAGYLTYIRGEMGIRVLGYPNNEVSDSVNAFRLSSMGLLASAGTIDELRSALAKEDVESIVQAYRIVFSRFPHEMRLKREENFHAAFYAFTLATKYDVEAEESSGLGQLDVRIAVSNNLYYIIELKVDGSAARAVDQVFDRNYYSKFFKAGRRIHVLGINFSSSERNIQDWKDEVIIL